MRVNTGKYIFIAIIMHSRLFQSPLSTLYMRNYILKTMMVCSVAWHAVSLRSHLLLYEEGYQSRSPDELVLTSMGLCGVYNKPRLVRRFASLNIAPCHFSDCCKKERNQKQWIEERRCVPPHRAISDSYQVREVGIRRRSNRDRRILLDILEICSTQTTYW